MKTFYFLCGLPRSGSTLLTSILSQNPEVFGSPNSYLVELLVNVRNHLHTTEQARAFMLPEQDTDILHGIMSGMYRFTDKPYIVDKSRAWPHPQNIELLNDLLPYQPKFIAMVRDLPSIMASFMRVVAENPAHVSYIDAQLRQQGRELNTKNRCEWLFSPRGTIYESWFSLKMGIDAGYGEQFHFIEYDELTHKPEETLKGLYDFMELEYYSHDLRHIENQTPENDDVYQLPGLHHIRPVLEKRSPDPKATLGEELYDQYIAVEHFWRSGAAPKARPHTAARRNPFQLKNV